VLQAGIEITVWTRKPVPTGSYENYENQKTGQFLVQNSNFKNWGGKQKIAWFSWKNRSVFLINRFLIGFSFKIQILNGKRQTDQYFRFIARFSGLSPGFLFFQKNIKILKISNWTDQFLVNQQNRSRPILSIFAKTGQFSINFESMASGNELEIPSA
jgi:hypothetical protein